MLHSETNIYIHIYPVALKTASQVAPAVQNLPANAGDARDVGVILGWGKISWSRKWQPTPVLKHFRVETCGKSNE